MPDMAGGSGDAGEALGAAAWTWKRLWTSSGRVDYRDDCMTDDLNAEEEEDPELL